MKTFRPGKSMRFQGESRLSPRLIVVSAPSGAGKSTLCAKLVAQYPEIIENVSFTTRKPRNLEEDGVDYFFVEHSEFEEKKSRDFFVEWANVHGHMYGVSHDQIHTALEAGRPIILDIDVQGARTLISKFPNALTIFIIPPSIKELERRLASRDLGKTNNFDLRMSNAEGEIAQAGFFKHQVVNTDLDEAYEGLKNIVESELGTS
jgi:guanylate kinase